MLGCLRTAHWAGRHRACTRGLFNMPCFVAVGHGLFVYFTCVPLLPFPSPVLLQAALCRLRFGKYVVFVHSSTTFLPHPTYQPHPIPPLYVETLSRVMCVSLIRQNLYL